MARYAERTTVAVESSRAEIERTLTRYGADQFMYGWDATRAVIAFRAHGKQVRFLLPLPARDDPQFTSYTRSYRTYSRSATEAERLWEQACRQRWRALALVIKAKLEAVEAGITEFETEFLAHIVLPDGETVGEWVRPQLEEAYATGRMPELLPLPGGPRPRPALPEGGR